MKESTETLLDRLTLAGWLLLVVHMGIFALLAPVLLFYLWPGLLQVGGRVTGYSLVGTALVTGGACFFAMKWLLEKCGITILRPQVHCPGDANTPPCRR